MKRKPVQIAFVCDKCGAPQTPTKEGNWEVFPNVPCSCVGTFKPNFSGQEKGHD